MITWIVAAVIFIVAILVASLLDNKDERVHTERLPLHGEKPLRHKIPRRYWRKK